MLTQRMLSPNEQFKPCRAFYFSFENGLRKNPQYKSICIRNLSIEGDVKNVVGKAK